MKTNVCKYDSDFYSYSPLAMGIEEEEANDIIKNSRDNVGRCRTCWATESECCAARLEVNPFKPEE